MNMDVQEAHSAQAICKNCGGTFGQHHGRFGCNCMHEKIEAYWAPFNAMPGYQQTREVVLEWERNGPQPCSCSHFEPLSDENAA